MKLQQQVFGVCLGFLALLGGGYPLFLGTSVRAQETPTAPSPTPQSSLDLNLLARAIAKFYQSERYQTESTLELQGMGAGARYQSRVQLKTIVQTPNQFRAELMFNPTQPGEQQRYTFVSNGDRVWIDQSTTKQYMVMSYQQFAESDHSFLIGISSQLFLTTAQDFISLFKPGGNQEQLLLNFLQSSLQGGKLEVQGEVINLEGTNVYVYKYTDSQQGFTLKIIVNPASAEVQQVQILGTAEGLNLSITETIITRIPVASKEINSFEFQPSAEMTQVEKIDLNLF